MFPKATLAIAIAVTVSGCNAFLPAAGPSTSAVVDGADQTTSEGTFARYEFIDVNAAVVEALRGRPLDSLLSSFGDGRMPSEAVIGIGDAVAVSVFEAGSGGLYSGTAHGQLDVRRLEGGAIARAGRLARWRDLGPLCRSDQGRGAPRPGRPVADRDRARRQGDPASGDRHREPPGLAIRHGRRRGGGGCPRPARHPGRSHPRRHRHRRWRKSPGQRNLRASVAQRQDSDGAADDRGVEPQGKHLPAPQRQPHSGARSPDLPGHRGPGLVE